MFDVNVWVANVLAAARGHDCTCCQLLVESAIVGQCRLGPLVSRISIAMLDTLETVLERELDFPPTLANAARNVAEVAGPSPLPAIVVVGGGVQPMLDLEDMGVLETALAASADLLVTNNMDDFTRGNRARIDAMVVRTVGGKPDVLLVSHSRLPNGLVVTTPFAAKAWLIDGYPPPPGVLRRFLPPDPDYAADDEAAVRSKC